MLGNWYNQVIKRNALTCDWQVLRYLKPGAEAGLETLDCRVMEDSSKPDRGVPGQGRTSAMSGSYPMGKLHSQTDSFLTAARLIRRGWTEEVKSTGGQLTKLNNSIHQPPYSKSDESQGTKNADVSLKEPQSMKILIVNSRKMAEEKEMNSEKKDEAKETYEGAFSANRQRERQVNLYSQAGIVCVRVSNCRTTCRQSRRFKAPILPVIAEM